MSRNLLCSISCLKLKPYQLRIISHRSIRKKNHYTVLNIKEDASVKEVRDAFVKLSKKHHPDVNSNASSHAEFINVKEAYDILSNKNKRQDYDIEQGIRQYSSVNTDSSNPRDYSHWQHQEYSHNDENFKQYYHASETQEDQPTGRQRTDENRKQLLTEISIVSLIWIGIYIVFGIVQKCQQLVNNHLAKKYEKERMFEEMRNTKGFEKHVDGILQKEFHNWTEKDRLIANNYVQSYRKTELYGRHRAKR